MKIFSLRVSLVLFAFLLSSCGTTRLVNQNLSENYDFRESILHPQFVVHHENDSISKIYIELSKNEILYKKNESGNYTGIIKISCSLFSSYESKTFIDTTVRIFSDSSPENDAFIIFNLDFKTPEFSKYVLQVEVKDIHRNRNIISLIQVDKSNRQSAQWFMLMPPSIRVPMFRNYVRPGETFSIYTPGGEAKQMYVRCYHRNFPIAAPPFGDQTENRFNYAADSIYETVVGPSITMTLSEEGFYHFQSDTAIKPGFSVFCHGSDFPRLTDANQLIESLRYITTQHEYEKLRLARDKKAAIDQFWIDLAGNQDRAKTLIRKYYTRIQEANRLFTSFLDGWKTDRGLIFTVMGPPSSVFRTSNYEEWTYGNISNMNSITFTFERIYNPFCDNDYILRRSNYYEQIWYGMVDRWRQGVVIND